jgi:peptidylprolyl isomerase
MDEVKQGDTVEVDYTGKFENGEVFDSSVDRDPLMFRAGAGQVIPGFDKAVLGMKVGDSKTVTIPPEEAYGTSGAHPLAGKTLVFEITLVGINPPEA